MAVPSPAFETWLASCQYGSPHLKEFVLLANFEEADGLHRKCSRDHQHVKIEGQWTKPSAVYTDALAEAIAVVFDKALCRKFRCEARKDHELVAGLESPVVNDVLVSGAWKVDRSWYWRKPAHINIQETSVVVQLLKDLAVDSPGTRNVVILDSNVGLSALVKGRSPSYGLRPCLRRAGATVVVGALFPSYHFGPARLNTADCPTRDYPLPEPGSSFISQLLDFDTLVDLAQVTGLRRPLANWARLFLLISGPSLAWRSHGESWRFAHHGQKHFPFTYGLRTRHIDFDSTLGYPGEGPSWIWGILALLLSPLWTCLAWRFPSAEAFPCLGRLLYGFPRVPACRVRVRPVWPGRTNPPKGWLIWVVILLSLGSLCHGAPCQSSLLPRDAGDLRRQQTRKAWEDLPTGRPVLGQTQAYRDKLFAAFEEWLTNEGFSLEELLSSTTPDVDAINLLLEKYGGALFHAGRPYGHYSETINSVTAKYPRLRRCVQQAWDLAFAWLRREPPLHHVALPWQALLSLLSTSLSWGWTRVAGAIALSWGGVTRIGEVLNAERRHLILPSDFGFTQEFALLEIREPKTRFSAARHQSARLDQPQLLKVLEVAFRKLLPGTKP